MKDNQVQAMHVGVYEPKRYTQRRFIQTIAAVLFCVSLSASAEITEGGRGMLFGADHAFAVTASSGWVLDNHSGASRGVLMIFYPKGGTWSESPVIIYGRAIPTTEAANVKTKAVRTVNEFRRNGSPSYSSKKQAQSIFSCSAFEPRRTLINILAISVK